MTLLSDLRYGAKMLGKSKGVTTVAVISLAVGIGANSAIFSLVNSILLRPRPVSHPEQLVELYVGEGEQPYQTTSYPSYVDLRDHNDVLSGLAAYGIQQFKFGDANEVEQIWGEAWQALEKQVHPFYALALQQSERKDFTVLVSSASGDPSSLVAGVRNTIRELDPK